MTSAFTKNGGRERESVIKNGVSDFCSTVRAVGHHSRSVVNATALPAEDPMLPTSACRQPHAHAHQWPPHRLQHRECTSVSPASCAEVGLVRQVRALFVRSAEQVIHELQVREEVERVRQEVREVQCESKVEESRSQQEHM